MPHCRGVRDDLAQAMNVAMQRAQGAKAELQAAQQLPGSCPLLDLFEDFIAFMGPCLEKSIEQPARYVGVDYNSSSGF